MGEVADMMLDGTLCEGCGVFMGDEVGYPRKCKACRYDERKLAEIPANPHATCPTCGKRVKSVGLAQHIAAKHSAAPNG